MLGPLPQPLLQRQQKSEDIRTCKPCVTRKTTQYCHCLCLSSVLLIFDLFFMLLTLSPLSLDFCRGLSFLFSSVFLLPLFRFTSSAPISYFPTAWCVYLVSCFLFLSSSCGFWLLDLFIYLFSIYLLLGFYCVLDYPAVSHRTLLLPISK